MLNRGQEPTEIPAHSKARRQKSPRCSDRHLRQIGGRDAVQTMAFDIVNPRPRPPNPRVAACSNSSNIFGSASGWAE